MTFWERFALIFTNAKYLDSMLTGLFSWKTMMG